MLIPLTKIFFWTGFSCYTFFLLQFARSVILIPYMYIFQSLIPPKMIRSDLAWPQILYPFSAFSASWMLYGSKYMVLTHPFPPPSPPLLHIQCLSPSMHNEQTPKIHFEIICLIFFPYSAGQILSVELQHHLSQKDFNRIKKCNDIMQYVKYTSFSDHLVKKKLLPSPASTHFTPCTKWYHCTSPV